MALESVAAFSWTASSGVLGSPHSFAIFAQRTGLVEETSTKRNLKVELEQYSFVLMTN